MRAFCFVALLVPAAGLVAHKALQTQMLAEITHPQYKALPGTGGVDLEVVWQRPKGPATGALLYLHGCGNRALDMFKTKGSDGWEFKACNNTKKGYCAGLPQEYVLKETARSRGYVVIAVQGGFSSNRGCFHDDDVPRIKQAIRHVCEVEHLGKMPLIMTGMSAGGRTLASVATSTGGAGVPMKCVAVQVAEIDAKMVQLFPKNVPIGFWHMPKDGVTEKLIQKNLKQLKAAKVKKIEDHPIEMHPITQEFLVAGGGMNKTTANRTMLAFAKAGVLKEDGTLRRDPYNPKPKTAWMKAVEGWTDDIQHDLRGDIGGVGQQAPLTKLLERSWASHSLAGDKTSEIIDFCESTKVEEPKVEKEEEHKVEKEEQHKVVKKTNLKKKANLKKKK